MGYLYLGLSILGSAYLVVFFKLAGRRRLQPLQMVVSNYITCVVLGMALNPGSVERIWHRSVEYLPLAVLEGSLFIGVFLLIGYAARSIGVGYTSLVTRMSVVLPIVLSVWVYGESLDVLKGLAVVLAIGAVLLMGLRGSSSQPGHLPWQQQALLTAALFLGSGLTDSLFKVFDELNPAGLAREQDFVLCVFATAAVWGSIALAWQLYKGTQRLHLPSWGAGVLLGVPNYFSAWLIALALRHFEGPVFFPLNNLGILLATAAIGILFFRERYSKNHYAGLLLALCAAALMLASQSGAE